jgi:hypothetical protein
VAWLAEQYIPLYTSCASLLESGDDRHGKSLVGDGYESSHEASRFLIRHYRSLDPRRSMQSSISNDSPGVSQFPYHVTVTLVDRCRLDTWIDKGQKLKAWAASQQKKMKQACFVDFQSCDAAIAAAELESKSMWPTLILESTECSPGLQDRAWLTASQLQREQARHAFFEWWGEQCPLARFFRYRRPVTMVDQWDLYQTMVAGYTCEPWMGVPHPLSPRLAQTAGELVFVDCKTGLRGVRSTDFFRGNHVCVVLPGIQGISEQARQSFQLFRSTQPIPVVPIGAMACERDAKQSESSGEEEDKKSVFRVWLRQVDWNVIAKRFTEWTTANRLTVHTRVETIEHEVPVVYVDLQKL